MPQHLPGRMVGLTLPELVRLLCNLRRLYPWMRILHKADGTVVVTISPPPQEGRQR
ncbi:hypothetical protein [Nocardia tengchongensis]|uniref:hypothetical protein n=1 Tax=Nocardia tengchongensis TaxID=2055889 RepID=UPI0036872667